MDRDPSLRERMRAEAVTLLARAVVHDERGEPCGTVASTGDLDSHYRNVWTRDNVAPMLYFMDESPRLVRSFLEALMRRQSLDRRTLGLIPIGFSTQFNLTDLGGEEAIGAIYSVDSTLWFLILLGLHVETTRDLAWLQAHRRPFDLALGLLLGPRFDPLPLMAAPESVTEIDRPAGLHGYPLQLQVLMCLALRWSARLLRALCDPEQALVCEGEAEAVQSWINRWYWIDRDVLAERADLPTEQYGTGNPNPFNLDYGRMCHATSWLQEGGFLGGTVRARHLDTRFWAFPNCLAALAGIVSERRAAALMDLVQHRAPELLGQMPLAVCWPELRGSRYQILMDSDPRGRPGVFHNGAYWPNLLWAFVPTALMAGRRDLAESALERATRHLGPDWGEYYDRHGRIGRAARRHQTWSIAGYLLANRALDALPGDDIGAVRLTPRGGW